MRFKFLCAAVLVLLLCSSSFAADELGFIPDIRDSQVMPPNNYICQTMLVGNRLITFRSWLDIPYVSKPIEPEYHRLNVYIPEEYFHEGGTINGYTAKTAPIILPNGVGGYMPGRAFVPANDMRHGGPNIALAALAHGYVVVAPAIRGRTLENGKAPALIVDYKAAVRWLRHNKDKLPAGDTEKIISDGLSAGGALSSLLGATGNAKDYDSYLKEIGAAEERDDIFASAVYCPITNLENADMPYEWIFNGVNTYHMGPAREMDENMKAASEALKAAFPAYLNSLELGYTLDEHGNGTFRTYIEGLYVAAAQKALDAGENVLGLDWLTVEDRKVLAADLNKYAVWATRMKAAPAFDSLNMKSYENNEFADKHFTEYSFKHSTAEKPAMADAEKIFIMNPMNFIGREGVTTAKHWRIRHGVKDRDTSLAIPAILALKLQKEGYDADVAAVWGVPHDGNYDIPELFEWIDSICK